MITLQEKCAICGKTVEISVYNDDYFKWRKGMLIQDAFPYLSPDDREMLVSHTCKECWDRMFSCDCEDPEEDEEVCKVIERVI